MPIPVPTDLQTVFLPHDIQGNCTVQFTQGMPSHWMYAHPLFDSDVAAVVLIQKKAGYARAPQLQGDLHSLMYVVQGELDVVSGDREMRLSPGMMAFCPNALPMGRTCPVDALFLCIDLMDGSRWSAVRTHEPYCRPCDYIELLVPAIVKLFLARDAQTVAAQSDAMQYSRFILDLVKRELRYVSKRTTAEALVRLEKLFSRVRLKPELSWRLADMADEADMSKRTFGRLVKAEYGFSPMELVMKHRVEKAVRFLTRTNMKMDEVAKTLNYGSTAAFSEMFLRYVGKRPGRFRRDYRNSFKTGKSD